MDFQVTSFLAYAKLLGQAYLSTKMFFSGNVQDGVNGGQTRASLSTAQRTLAHFKEL
ncbi:hypothetical protein DPMN_133721 [Dreissena polymorpha]|uniref:Uncharacterized protein n=1 Tax=Dreissena polymorpha TaxID=45954 RepID=A0A9D4FUV8_DREPO|nr:hypothetical protein DPMN_082696 [Dreissena polymorpha]KAH3805418.1 hypothetical protein DPMN_133721 [Dreissena polymorpha]